MYSNCNLAVSWLETIYNQKVADSARHHRHFRAPQTLDGTSGLFLLHTSLILPVPVPAIHTLILLPPVSPLTRLLVFSAIDFRPFARRGQVTRSANFADA